MEPRTVGGDDQRSSLRARRAVHHRAQQSEREARVVVARGGHLPLGRGDEVARTFGGRGRVGRGAGGMVLGVGAPSHEARVGRDGGVQGRLVGHLRCVLARELERRARFEGASRNRERRGAHGLDQRLVAWRSHLGRRAPSAREQRERVVDASRFDVRGREVEERARLAVSVAELREERGRLGVPRARDLELASLVSQAAAGHREGPARATRAGARRDDQALLDHPGRLRRAREDLDHRQLVRDRGEADVVADRAMSRGRCEEHPPRVVQASFATKRVPEVQLRFRARRASRVVVGNVGEPPQRLLQPRPRRRGVARDVVERRQPDRRERSKKWRRGGREHLTKVLPRAHGLAEIAARARTPQQQRGEIVRGRVHRTHGRERSVRE
jgi:hypothetical protein